MEKISLMLPYSSSNSYFINTLCLMCECFYPKFSCVAVLKIYKKMVITVQIKQQCLNSIFFWSDQFLVL